VVRSKGSISGLPEGEEEEEEAALEVSRAALAPFLRRWGVLVRVRF